jgi:hypothetical protein
MTSPINPPVDLVMGAKSDPTSFALSLSQVLGCHDTPHVLPSYSHPVAQTGRDTDNKLWYDDTEDRECLAVALWEMGERERGQIRDREWREEEYRITDICEVFLCHVAFLIPLEWLRVILRQTTSYLLAFSDSLIYHVLVVGLHSLSIL